MGVRLLLEDYRSMLKRIDELYAESPRADVRKLNDDLIFAIKNALKERHKLLGSSEKAERGLEGTLKIVRKEYEKMIESGISGLKKKLELAKNMLSEKVDVIKRKYEEVKSKRLNLDAKAKSLIKEGRIEDAEVLLPEITALEEGERLFKGFINAIGKVESRIGAVLTKIDVYETITKLDLNRINFEELKDLKGEAEKTVDELRAVEDELGAVLTMTGTDILSGALSEAEVKTLRRLIEEVGDVREDIKRYVDELEDAEKRLKEMKS